MTKQRRLFTREFKIEAVRRVLEDGRSISQVAADLELNTNLVGRWKREFLSEPKFSFPGDSFLKTLSCNKFCRRIFLRKCKIIAGVLTRTGVAISPRLRRGISGC